MRESSIVNNNLVVSLFPGIGLLDRAFEEEGFCVVRGPEPLWGGDIREFHPPADVFGGIIGGPPCQVFSKLKSLNPRSGEKHGNLIPEFERCVDEAQPEWFLMENVPQAPEPSVAGYSVHNLILDNRWVGGKQRRKRRFSFGSKEGQRLQIEVVALESFGQSVTVLAGHGPVGRGNGYHKNPSIAQVCKAQGLPPTFLDEAPFTVHGKRKVLGNGVPLPTGRAVARAIKNLQE